MSDPMETPQPIEPASSRSAGQTEIGWPAGIMAWLSSENDRDYRNSAASMPIIWNKNTLQMAAARGELPVEPEQGGVLVKLRFPLSADNVPTLQRRFPKDATLKDVFKLTVAEGITLGYVNLVVQGRPREFSNLDEETCTTLKLGDLTENDELKLDMEWSMWYLERKLFH